RLASALSTARDGVCGVIARRLRSLSGGSSTPLIASALRGGIVRDETWAERPDVPAILSSTVDQVGSRLLFRGYGLSASMRPIHAGLLANDTLFLLDEVHLARPFAATLADVRRYRSFVGRGTSSLPERWHVVELTATPTTRPTSIFPAQPIDAMAHPVLRRRVHASKPARLEEIKVAKNPEKASEQFAAACVQRALGLLKSPAQRTIAVIVNRVDTARRVASLLREKLDEDQVVLLTGRMRTIDRDAVLRQIRGRVEIGRERDPNQPPLVVVSTQSIEAGADFDFDGIVTECASLGALRQRFGRVDRDGTLHEANTPAQSVILVRSTDVEAAGPPDPIYGHSLAATWRWLSERATDGTIDLGPSNLVVSTDEITAKGLEPEPDIAPRLLPDHLDRLVQTWPPLDEAEPEIGRWLHGMSSDTRVADIGIVWRDDLHPSLFEQAIHDERPELEQAIVNRVAMCPPTQLETLSVPISAFHKWARGAQVDVESTDMAAGALGDDLVDRDDERLWLRWTGASGELVRRSEIRPGDLVVVPSELGGLRHGNWDPSSSDAVADVSTISRARRHRRAVVSLSRALAGRLPIDAGDAEATEISAADDVTLRGSAAWPDPRELSELNSSDRREAVVEYLRWLRDRADELGLDGFRDVVAHLAGATNLLLRALPERVDDDGRVVESYVVTSPAPLPDPSSQRDGASELASDDGEDVVSFIGSSKVVALDEHLGGVATWARSLAENLGFAPTIVDDVTLAGRVHDVGKVDPRFQLWLHQGDELAWARADQPLAKSTAPDTDRAERRRARRASGYPAKARHELLSLAMVGTAEPLLKSAHDPELVQHLVASHHGFGRYRFDPIDDPAKISVEWEVDGHRLSASTDHALWRLDAGAPARFWRLVRRYGWFQLA
ncbi:MAG TPA: type I-U CRISPR-associated helicase/endonuclease Cas3, partial [Acidimicrobiales bacterium]